MRNKGQFYFGLILVLLGLMFLANNLFNIRLGAYCWPGALVLLGVWLLARPRLVSPDTAVVQRILGDIDRDGAWEVTNEEIWLLVGDVKLDMTEAIIPEGETLIRIYGFVGDVKLDAPADVGVDVTAHLFAGDVITPGRKQEGVFFFAPVQAASEDYKAAERRIRLETTRFAGDVKVRQAGKQPKMEAA